MTDTPRPETPLVETEDRIHPGGRIVVGVDGSAESLSALRRGARMAERLGCSLVGVTVWEYPPSWPGYVMGGWDPERDARTISEDAEMLIVGSRGLGGFTGLLLGSVSRSVVEHADCPVLVIHGS